MSDLKSKAPHLQRVNLAVTTACNLRCRMCDIPESNFWTKALPREEIKRVIKEAADLGAEVVELSGGEPMMRKDIYEIISYAASLGLKVFMATNGGLIGEAQVKKLLEAGLTLVTFSLEGPEELNDHIRGRGNFQKTLAAIRGFLSCRDSIPGLEVMVGITLSKYNYKVILPFSKYLLEEVGVTSISIGPFEGARLTQKNRKAREEEFNIPPVLFPDLVKEIEQLIQYGESVPGKLPPAPYLRRIPDYFAGKKLVPPGGCRIPLTFYGITAHGHVFSCWQSPAVGNLKQGSLSKISDSKDWEKTAALALEGKCSGCLSSCYFEMYQAEPGDVQNEA